MIVNLEIVLREFLGPTDLFGAQTLCIHKAIKIVVIYQDKYFILTTFQIVMPRLRNFDNSQKIIIINLVSSFCINYFLRKEDY